MSSDITEFNLNDIILRSINIFTKSKTFLDIAKNKHISERKKLRLLRLLNMFPNFADMLKIYKIVQNIDSKSYIENMVDTIKKQESKEKYTFFQEHEGKEYSFEYFLTELKKIIHSDDTQKGGSETSPAPTPAPTPSPTPATPTPAQEPPTPAQEAPATPAPATPALATPTPAPASEPVAASEPASEPGLEEPVPETLTPGQESGQEATPEQGAEPEAIPEEDRSECCDEKSKLYKELDSMLTQKTKEIDESIESGTFLSNMLESNDESEQQTLLNVIKKEPYNKVYENFSINFTEEIAAFKDQDKPTIAILVNMLGNPKYMQIISELITNIPLAKEKFAGNPILIIINTIKSTFDSVIAGIEAGKKTASTVGGLKDIIALVVSIIADVTGVGAPFAAASTAVGATGLIHVFPILLSAGEMLKPLAKFGFLISIKHDKEAAEYLLNNYPPIMVAANICLLVVSSIKKVVNTDNMCLFINYELDTTTRTTVDNTLDKFLTTIQTGGSINIEELIINESGEQTPSININSLFTNGFTFFTDIVIASMYKMLGLKSTCALLSLYQQLNIQELKKTLDDIKKSASCPDNPINKLSEWVDFIINFLNVPGETIGKLILPFTSLFGVEDTQDTANTESGKCPNK